MRKFSYFVTMLALILFAAAFLYNATSVQSEVSFTSNKGTALNHEPGRYLYTSWGVVPATTATDTFEAIDVTEAKALVVQISAGSTVSGSIDGATNTFMWLEGTTMNPGAAASSVAYFTKYVTQAGVFTSNPAASSESIDLVTALTEYGTYKFDVEGLTKVRLGIAGNSAAVTTVVTIK